MGKLYIVSTPIGNLEDITLRALRIIKESDLILAEDTRSTSNLLSHYQIPKKELVSFFEGNEERKISDVINQLVLGKNIALVSEAGTPLISDPGFKLVREAVRLGIAVEAIPGPTAFISALVVSGLPANACIFLGFLPKKENKIRDILSRIKEALTILKEVKTVVFYESPYRVIKTLKVLHEVYGDINIVVAREMTKIHEEIRREKITESLQYFSKVAPRGEFTILFSTLWHS